ncbi:unnamed protein product [Paramecium pentaurelia]|uniref:Transmembrane protein n=1 Tax=Paramecium pentaurelia TaxID=43138 RepID=A0A8S1V7T0_9CILI|nr:unnamed protein product [Paramecium pentaurelia]
MLSSNNQDEAMLSERNEQELFQSDSSSEANESENQLDEENENDKIEPENPSFQEQQPLLKDEHKKKEIKETCLEKLKGYIGFGNFLTSQKIGYVFFIPISSKWTFKMQVIITQLIIATVSLGVFFGIRFLGQDIFKNIIQDWSKNNFAKLQQEQIQQVSEQFITLCQVTLMNEIQFAQVMNEVFQQRVIQWDEDQLISMEQNLDEYAKFYQYASIIDYATQSYSTYMFLNQTILSINDLQYYLSTNYLMKYNYVTLTCSFFWIFQNGLMVQYPGINVTDIQQFRNYRKNIDLLHKETSEFVFDDVLQNYVQRSIYPIKNSINETIGNVFIERLPQNFKDLFMLFATSDLLNYTIIISNNDGSIVYQSVETSNFTINIIKQLIDNFGQFKVHDFNLEQDGNSQNPYKIYKGIINNTIHSISIIRLNFIIIIVYPYTLLEKQLQDQEEEFYTYDKEFNERYLAACIAAPLIYIILVVFFLVREIKPLEEITQLAQMSLKKSQAFDEKSLSNIKGNGLISHLTSLFSKLMLDLNQLKLEKKKQIIDFYNSQTYPKNNKVKNVDEILKEIEKINIEQIQSQSPIQIPNYED